LTGIGPWTVLWNDGTPETTNGTAPVTLLRAVAPTNAPGSSFASNFVYYVTNVVNADTCLGNETGDILGTNTIIVNPRPTALITSSDVTRCDYGQTNTLTVKLTGIGPWTVLWNDGTPQTTNGTAPVTLLRAVAPTNAPGSSFASNFVYYVTNVANADTCLGNETGDILGTNTIIVNPRPTALITSTDVTRCDYGQTNTLAVQLTGIGPWTVLWNDGTPQTTNGTAPVTLLRAVAPTNAPGSSFASNFVYYVTNVANADTCLGNETGDILGTNTIIVNPRPTALITSTDVTRCDYGQTNTLAVQLTGIGPWTVLWNDGTPQTTNGTAPVTLLRAVAPTNAPGSSFASNFVYYVTNVANADTCLGNEAGDILGTNTIIVNPRPTALITSTDVTRCDYGQTNTLAVQLTGIGPWTVLWNDGTPQTTNGTAPVTLLRPVAPTNAPGSSFASNFVYYVTNVVNADTCLGNEAGDILGTNTIIVNPRPTALITSTDVTRCDYGQTNTLAVQLTGIGPWTVLWNDGTPQTTNGTAPVTLVRAVAPAIALGSSFASNFVYYVTNVANADTCLGNEPGDILGTNSITVNPRPTAVLTSTNTTLCSGATNTLSVTLSGIGPWTIVWNDGTNQVAGTNGQPGPVILTRDVAPTNELDSALASNVVYFVQGVSNNDTCIGNLAGDIAGTNMITVDPLASQAPALLTVSSNGTVYSCADIPVVLQVAVSNGYAADWYDANTNFLLTSSTFPVTNTSPANLSFYVSARFADSNASCSGPSLAVPVVLTDCTRLLSVPSVTSSNVTISWFGNYYLEFSTNLAPPFWSLIYTGAYGSNGIVISTTNPQGFFRLHSGQ
jgi:hypothetical protein